MNFVSLYLLNAHGECVWQTIRLWRPNDVNRCLWWLCVKVSHVIHRTVYTSPEKPSTAPRYPHSHTAEGSKDYRQLGNASDGAHLAIFPKAGYIDGL